MSYVPVQDRVLVEPLQITQSAGGIIFSDNAIPQSVEARVIAVGPGKENKKGVLIPVAVEPGDKIIFQRGEGHEVTFDGKTLLVIKEENIFGVIE